jgi:hypothetical protein
MNPYLHHEMARIRQADLLREARLAHIETEAAELARAKVRERIRTLLTRKREPELVPQLRPI